LVKTVKFKDPTYVGDPINAVKIFNEKEVDEIIILDTLASSEGGRPQFSLIADIASQCFMPLAYGGGVSTLDDVHKLITLGVEKVSINTAAVETPHFINQAVARFATSTIVVAIDYRRTHFGRLEVYTRSGRRRANRHLVDFAREAADRGAGELLINSIDQDGTMTGYDIDALRRVSGAVNVPVIACGGAGTMRHFTLAVAKGGVSAVAAGSMFVFHGKHRAVLINYPPISELQQALDAQKITQ
jgi:cyclase